MDALFDPYVFLDTPIGHYVLAATTLLLFVGWLHTEKNAEFRKMMAVALGGTLATIALVLLVHFFPPGPPTPGAMP